MLLQYTRFESVTASCKSYTGLAAPAPDPRSGKHLYRHSPQSQQRCARFSQKPPLSCLSASRLQQMAVEQHATMHCALWSDRPERFSRASLHAPQPFGRCRVRTRADRSALQLNNVFTLLFARRACSAGLEVAQTFRAT